MNANMDIMQILKKAICEINVVVEEDEIPVDKGLINVGILDSFGFVELIGFIEREFDFEVGEDEITTENFKDLNATHAFIEKKLA